MNGNIEQRLSGGTSYFGYGNSLVPRVVDVPESASSCRLLPPPVQIIRGLSADERATMEKQKPGYLLLKFGGTESPHSTPFADLTSLD